MRSRSARKEGLVGARGARCVVANSRAVDIETEGLVVEEEEMVVVWLVVAERMSSMSWRRRREK